MSDSYANNIHSHPERLAGGAPPSAVATASQGTLGGWTGMPGMMLGNNSGSSSSSRLLHNNGLNYGAAPRSSPYSADPPPGLLNIGETCYLNSVIQVLYHTPAFRRAILDYDIETEPSSLDTMDEDRRRVVGNAQDVSLALKHLFRNMGDTTREWVQPMALVDMLRDKTREFEFIADGQQDAHEFLHFLLENVSTAFETNNNHKKKKVQQLADDRKKRSADDSNSASSSASSQRPKKRPRSTINGTSSPASAPTPLTKNIKNRFEVLGEETVLDGSDTPPPNYPPLGATPLGTPTRPGATHTPAGPSHSGKPALTLPMKAKPKENSRAALLDEEANLVRRIFRGESVTSTRCCECETASDRPEAFLDLSIPVTIGESMPSLLSNMAAGDMLDGNNKYACSVCHTKTEAERRFYLSYLPPVVTIHLKLFQYTQYQYGISGTGGKIPVATPAPFRMRFDTWCTKEAAKTAPNYQLTAIIVHTGGCSTSGHYFSYVYNKQTDSWYRCDDSKVNTVKEEDIETSLFYSSGKSKETGYLLFYTKDDDEH